MCWWAGGWRWAGRAQSACSTSHPSHPALPCPQGALLGGWARVLAGPQRSRLCVRLDRLRVLGGRRLALSLQARMALQALLWLQDQLRLVWGAALQRHVPQARGGVAAAASGAGADGWRGSGRRVASRLLRTPLAAHSPACPPLPASPPSLSRLLRSQRRTVVGRALGRWTPRMPTTAGSERTRDGGRAGWALRPVVPPVVLRCARACCQTTSRCRSKNACPRSQPQPPPPPPRREFDARYGGNRAPMGVYIHATATGWMTTANAAQAARFLQYAAGFKGGWMGG